MSMCANSKTRPRQCFSLPKEGNMSLSPSEGNPTHSSANLRKRSLRTSSSPTTPISRKRSGNRARKTSGEKRLTSGPSSGKGRGNAGKFTVRLSKRARHELDSLPPDTGDRILDRLTSLESAPFPRGKAICRIKGPSVPLYRLRVGAFRVVFEIHERNVEVAFVCDRKELDRKIKQYL